MLHAVPAVRWSALVSLVAITLTALPAQAGIVKLNDVFLTAFRRLDQLRFEVSARAWLHGVTRRIAARHHRTTARRSRRHAALALGHDPDRPATLSKVTQTR